MVLSLTTLIGAVGYRYYLSKDQLLAIKTAADLDLVSASKANQIQQWLRERTADARVAMTTPGVIDQVETLISAPENEKARTELAVWMDALRSNYQYGSLAIYDTTGQVRLSSPRTAPDSLAEPISHIRDTMAADGLQLSDLHTDVSGGGMHLNLAVPLHHPGKPIRAVLLFRIDPQQFLFPLLRSIPSSIGSAETWLLRRETNEVVLVSTERSTNGILARFPAEAGSPLLAVKAALFPDGNVRGVDSKGVARIGSARAVEGTGWVLLVSVAHEQVDAPLRREAKLIVLVGSLSFLGLAAASVLVWREQSRGMLRRQLQLEHALAARERRLATLMLQGHDAVMVLDPDFKVLEFNNKALNVYGYTHEEMGCLFANDLRPPELRSGQSRDLARFAQPDGACYETVHQRKDGTRFPVEISGRMVESDASRDLVVFIRDISERKRADAQLRRSEERFRQVFIMSPFPMGLASADGTVVLINHSFTKLLGYTIEDVPTIERWWMRAYPDPLHRARVNDIWSKAVASSDRSKLLLEPVESVLVCKDGSQRFMEVAAMDLGGEFLVALFDLSQRKAAERALREEQEFTRSVIENLNAGVIACDASGRMTLFNRVARLWHGLDPAGKLTSEWPGTDVLFEADGRTPMLRGRIPLARVLMGESEVRGVLMVIAPPGHPSRSVLANASSIRSDDGRALGAVVILHDMTQIYQAEAALHLQGAALNAADNEIVITDANGVIVWANRSFLAQSNLSLKEIETRPVSWLTPTEDKAPVYHEIWSAIQSGKVWRGEIRTPTEAGTVVDEEMTVTPVRGAEGGITHFVAIKQDVTQRKALEHQYLRAQRMEGIGLLAGGIAHDLNNVLAPILMSADFLRVSNLPPEVAPIVDVIEGSARRGADIVKQVLTFARGVEGKTGILQVRHLVKDMVRMATETFPRNLNINAQLPSDLWPARGDATQIHQVLLNLSVNARDAMPGGGDLVFSAFNARFAADHPLPHPDLAPGDYVCLEVSDTGSGIPPEMVDRIFEPFFTTKEPGKGTGLGLSTVIGIVRSHAGAVTVDSQPGRGSRFQVYLPAQPLATEPGAESLDLAFKLGRNELVLLVDDEPRILNIARTVLERHRYRVVTAGNGVEALKVYAERQNEISLVLTDLMMPGMDGAALVQRLHVLRPDLICVASSGMMDAKDNVRRDDLKASGVRHFLTKPYSAEALLAILDEALHSNGSPSERVGERAEPAG